MKRSITATTFKNAQEEFDAMVKKLRHTKLSVPTFPLTNSKRI